MRCATHPDIETNLRCGKCDKPICPKCMVQTPVGARCRECARLYRLPTYRMSTQYYLRAAAAGIGMAIATGATWGFVSRFFPFAYINWIIGAGIGFATAEAISRAVNKKRGTQLAVIAGVATGLSYLVAWLVPWGLRFNYLDILAIALGIFISVTRIR